MRRTAPSSAYRWVPCPGSAALTENEQYKPSEPARQGCAAHALCEFGITKRRVPLTLARVGPRFIFSYQDEPSEIPVTQDVLDKVNVFLLEVQRQYERLNLLDGEAPEVFTEHVCNLSHVHENFRRKTRQYRADCVLVGHGEVVIMDYKNGRAGVQLEREDGTINEQMMCYAEALDAEYCGMKNTFTLVVVQPLSSEVSAIQTVSTTQSYVNTWTKRVLQPAVVNALSDEPTLKTGPQCRYCTAAAVCPELTKQALAMCVDDFRPYAEKPVVKDIQYVGRNKMLELLPMIPTIKHFIKSVEDYIYGDALKGIPIPGYKLVNGKGQRSWTSADTLFEDLKALGVPEVYEEKSYKSPHVIETEYPYLKKAIVKLVTKTSGSPTLVPISDKRQEIKITSGFEGYAVTEPQEGGD